MALSDLASIGGFVSGVSVLISLIYLSVQVRQAERNQRAIIQQGRAARATDTLLRIAEGGMTEVYVRGLSGDDDLSASEIMQFRLMVGATMFGFEDTYLQHKQGLLDEAGFESTLLSIRFSFRRPGYRAAWKMRRSMHDRGFADFVDRIVQQAAVADPIDELAHWKAALAAEKIAPIKPS
jgi:hypothetical protein